MKKKLNAGSPLKKEKKKLLSHQKKRVSKYMFFWKRPQKPEKNQQESVKTGKINPGHT